MNFERLHMYRNGDTVKASIEFKNELGSVSLVLDQELAEEILKVCAEALVRVSKKAADEMTAKILDGLGLKIPEITNASSEDMGMVGTECPVCGEVIEQFKFYPCVKITKEAQGIGLPETDNGREDCPYMISQEGE